MRPKRGQPGCGTSGGSRGRSRVKMWLMGLVVVTMLLQAAGVLGAGCTGTTPANSGLCLGDDAGFIGTKPKTLVPTCTPATKCEYTCNIYYKRAGNSCVPNICTGPIPAAPAALCTGDDTQLTTDTSRALEYYCSDAKKCEYYCSLAGSVKEGTSCVTLTSCTAANTRLVGWWRGEQNFNDASPNLVQGTGSGVDFSGGKVGSAFRFDSSGSDLITVSDANVLDIIGTLTLELWIKPIQAGDKQIIRKMVGSPIRGYGLVMTADRHIKFWINGVTLSSNFPVELNDWTHVAAVYSPDSYMKIYLDGIPHGVKDTGVPALIESNTAALKIGGGVSRQHFFGELDEISIYNQALDVSEIQHIVAAGLTVGQYGKCLFAESVCTDGLDNDEDGKTDCADSTCVGFVGDTAGHLCEAVESNCADGFDNDGDGSADIADVTNCHKGKGCTKSDGTTGEIVWTYYLPNQQTQANAGTAPQLSQRGCCGIGQGQCATEGAGCINKYTLTTDPQWICGDNNNFNRCATATAGTNVGDYTCQNNQWLILEDCTNGLDDDGNGATDCLDSQCSGDAAACSQNCVTAPAGLQAWWKGEGNAQDASGNGRGATLGSSSGSETATSTPTFTTAANGVVGQAIHFDGDDLFRMADSENFNFGKSNAFTLEAWVKTASGSGTIMGKKTGSSFYRGYALYLNDGYLKADINTGSSSYFLAKRSAQKINTNKWVHVAMSYDGSGLLSGLQLYINGEKLEGADLNYQDGNNDLDNTGTNIQNTLPFKLGSYGGPTVADSNEKFTGDIDEPAVYNQALLPVKINDIYRSGLQGKCPPEDCTTPADDDNDGAANCADSDCVGKAACVETECNDNVDNDLDNVADCLDTDCTGSTPAPNCQKVSCTILPDGLISWWAADGNELDSVNNNHARRGTLPGADAADPAYTSSSVITGKAFSFDGGDFLQVMNEENFDFSFAEPFSLEGWFKSSAITGTKPIFNKRAATGSGYTLALSNGRLKFLIASSTAGQTIARDTSASYADNSWHHVIVTYDGSRLVSGMTMYVDGSQVGTSATGAIPATEEIQNDELLLIGKWAGNLFTGLLDELAVYDRALTSSEAGILYRKGLAAQHRCLEKCDNSLNDDEDSQIDGKDSECENKQCDNEGRVGVASSLDGNTFYGCCFGGGNGECADSAGTCFIFDTLTTVTASGNPDNQAVCASNNDFQLCSTNGEVSADRHYYCYQQQWRECNSANVQLVGKQQEFKCVGGRWVDFLDEDLDGIENALDKCAGTPPGKLVYSVAFPDHAGCQLGDLSALGCIDLADWNMFLDLIAVQNLFGDVDYVGPGDLDNQKGLGLSDWGLFLNAIQNDFTTCPSTQ